MTPEEMRAQARRLAAIAMGIPEHELPDGLEISCEMVEPGELRITCILIRADCSCPRGAVSSGCPIHGAP